MNQTKQQKRTAFTMSAKSMLSTLLLLIAMLVPQGAWAHYIEVTNGEGTSRYNFENNELTVTSVTEDEGDEDGYVTVTCTSPNDGQGYGTIIIPTTFEYETTENTEFYNIEMLADDKVYITAVDYVVVGNPYIFKGSVTFSYKKDDLAPVVPGEFGNVRFTGTYEELTLHQDEDYYFNGEKFVKVSEDVTVNPFCCYIDGNGYGSLYSELSIVLEDEDDDEGEHEHNFEVSSCDWSEDYTTATLHLVCSRDAEHTANVEVTLGEGITWVDTPATCTSPGVCTFTATATYEGKTYTGTAIVATDPIAEHNLDEHNVCTECGHGFIFFEADDPNDIEPTDPWQFWNSEGPVEYLGNTNINGEYAFEFSGLVTEIGNVAFSYCQALTAIYLPEVTTIGEDAFWGCNHLDNVSLPKATSIGQEAFIGNHFSTISLPEATTIGYGAFWGCGNLRSIELPKATTIENDAFYECSNLNSITVACAADLSGAEIPEGATITRVHDFSSKTLTAEPDADGLYAYSCDRGCGAHSDDHIVKANNASEGESATIELTSTTVGGTTTYTAAAPVAVPDGAFSTPVDFTATGAQVSIARTFTAETPATINLPFDVDASAMSDTYYTFDGIAYNEEKGKWEATMVPATGTLTANTPYIVMPSGTSLGITDNTATVSFKADASANSTTTSGDWTMTAAKAPKTWAAGDPELGKIYGFAGQAMGDISVGQFVRAAAGASIAAGRAYLQYNGEGTPTRAGEPELPSTIEVRFVVGSTTGIGTIDTESGEFTFDGWYDLNGRRVSEPTKGGIYFNKNKKIIVK